MKKSGPSYGQNGQLVKSWGAGSLWPLKWAEVARVPCHETPEDKFHFA
jgi:hypothetical protein